MSDCLFCKIVEGTIPARKAYEDDQVLAFHDIQPQAPVHLLVIPKKHIATMNDCEAEDAALLGQTLLAAQKVAAEAGLAESGYRLINNCGRDAGQLVFHIHWHILGGEKLGSLNPSEKPSID
ncbi:histidine triad nucleotide-binding protein [Cohnella endophytica]|uniref:Histidine triad nucleotide-binding protein n=1 Tax=Cohnella endophytica TaxID=2419778 RepID=A0A494Y1G4_9BACL|nr:histidine triad nucleotide-binding protein [Cohnella endophytica]RKP55213.1 histidine triad nucleotide-binding protein [Cohnella endophytica]